MIVTLTDFGNSEYLGAMKGAVYSINPDAKIIDFFNNITRYSAREGAWLLYKNYKFFPKGSIFLCIVDPGVGGERRCIAAKTKSYYFVGPDNGLMYRAIIDDGIVQVAALSTQGASKTFHGRDVFAKAAARLENGESISRLGHKTYIRKSLDFYLEGRKGEVVRIDDFGNIITTLPALNKTQYSLRFGNIKKTLKFYGTYEDAGSDLFAILGSGNTMEISLKNGNASEKLKLKVGDIIELA